MMQEVRSLGADTSRWRQRIKSGLQQRRKIQIPGAP